MTKTICALNLFFVLACAACASESEEPSSEAPCESAPEVVTALTPRGIQANGIQSNGIQTNGVQNNGIQNNRIAVNGIQGNRIALNGVQMNGVVLRGAQLVDVTVVGATVPALLSDGTTIDLAITASEPSPEAADVTLYEVTYLGQNICEDGAKGLFVPGVWDEKGARHDAITLGNTTATATFSCVTGVIAKCVRWGYAPDRVGAALHQTCTRMARADYCGTGVSYTKDGTAIDVADVNGIQRASNEAGFLFEAGWSEKGAVCVSRARYDARDEHGTALVPPCFRDLPVRTTAAEATQRGATITNASRPQTRRLCH